MSSRILGYGMVLVVALFSIWASSQLGQKQDVTFVNNTIDLTSKDTSLQSGSELDVRFKSAPESTAIGVFTLDGEKIVGLNDDKRWPIASLSKLMTALVTFREINASRRITITKEMIDITDGSAGDFRAGEQYSVSDLEKALLVVSNNAAAEALSSVLGRDKFLGLMNEYAARLGLQDTHFVDPSGLSIGNQSTVQNLLTLVKYILINEPAIFEVSRQVSASITDLTSETSRELKNINQFAGRADFMGGKTGTTPESVGNLISIFRGTKGGTGFIIILLGTEDRFNETRKLLNVVLTK